MATGHGEGGLNGRGKAKSVAGSQRLAPPQWRCAPHPLSRGGEFSCNLPVSRQETSLAARCSSLGLVVVRVTRRAPGKKRRMRLRRTATILRKPSATKLVQPTQKAARLISNVSRRMNCRPIVWEFDP